MDVNHTSLICESRVYRCGQPFSPAQIARVVGISEGEAWEALAQLVEIGLAGQPARGLFARAVNGVIAAVAATAVARIAP